MGQMTQSDAELVYKYLSDAVKGDVESEAFAATLDDWQTNRPDDYERLEAAHAADDSMFAWENIYFETVHAPERARPHELQALTGVEPDDEPDVYDLARDFATDYLAAVVDGIRSMQAQTDFSGREFVALVLDAAPNTPEDLAHREMGISLGNYRGKKGAVSDKLKTAETTVSIAERIGR